jgi:hypothetical protein
MILKVAILEVISGQEGEFERAFSKCSTHHFQHERVYLPPIATMPGGLQSLHSADKLANT